MVVTSGRQGAVVSVSDSRGRQLPHLYVLFIRARHLCERATSFSKFWELLSSLRYIIIVCCSRINDAKAFMFCNVHV